MMRKTRSAWLSLCLAALLAASCDFPRLPELADGGGGDHGGLALDLELMAGDIGSSGNADGTGATARFHSPAGVAVDSAGNVYVVDRDNFTIRRVTPAGVVTTLAGTAGMSGSADGTGAAARFGFALGVAVDSADNVYVADADNNTIRKVSAAGVTTTLAGTPGAAGCVDDTGAAARFSFPAGVAVDSAGNVYVADEANHTIRKVTPAGFVTTLAGTPGVAGSADDTGAAARFNFPAGVAVDSARNVYVADRGNHTLRKITPAGVVTTLAGTVGMSASVDGTGAAAHFAGPDYIAVDGAGNILVTESNDLRKVTSTGVVTTLAGTANMRGSVDGTGAAARFGSPAGVAADSAGNVYVADFSNNTVRKVTAMGVVTTLAGTAMMTGSADGMGAAVGFKVPFGVATDGAGNVYVADGANGTIRKVAVTGVVTTLAGTAGMRGSVDGVGAAARFGGPAGMAVDSAGNIYVADQSNFTLRMVTAAGVVTTLAGSAGLAGSADGTGAAARFRSPTGVAVDSAGNAYVVDQFDSTLRKITPAGVVTTLAGTAGMRGSADGTGAAARFNYPVGVAVDSAGNIYVADSSNGAIRKVTAAGIVTTLAGTAGLYGRTDGVGAAARFNWPTGATIDSAGNIYILDGSTVRKVTPTGSTTTIAGTADVVGIQLGATPRFAFPRCLAIVGDSVVLSDASAILLLRHGAR